MLKLPVVVPGAVISILVAVMAALGWEVMESTGADVTYAQTFESELCLLNTGTWIRASNAGSCEAMLLESSVCEVVTTNSTYRIRVPFAQPGIGHMAVSWILSKSAEQAVDANQVNPRRGRFDQSSDNGRWPCEGTPPSGSDGTTWSFAEDPFGNVVLVNPNPYRTVFFTLPATKEAPR